MGYLDSLLEGCDWFVGNDLSAADVQLSFAYQKAIERGGAYAFG